MDNDFQCPICFDSVPENLTTQIPQCKHRFCVACLAEFVRVKLNSHEYPLLCPTCVAEPRPQPTAEIENLVVDQLSERDLSILEEIRKKRDGFLKIECPRQVSRVGLHTSSRSEKLSTYPMPCRMRISMVPKMPAMYQLNSPTARAFLQRWYIATTSSCKEGKLETMSRVFCCRFSSGWLFTYDLQNFRLQHSFLLRLRQDNH
ncbi:hypothetical protein E4T56_gene18183 [Termitomyces sp. T112]|nr:hypothetical protein E4T56_gene18183 [Termitomyces sp. T112]